MQHEGSGFDGIGAGEVAASCRTMKEGYLSSDFSCEL